MTQSIKLPPGPKGLPVFGNAYQISTDPLGFLMACTRQYGDVVRMSLMGSPIYLFNHPDAVDEILLRRHEHLIKDSLTRMTSLVVGSGLLTSEGDFWRRQRRLVQPAFHHARIAAYADVMVSYAERAAAGWQRGPLRDLYQDMLRLTLDIVAKTLFGSEPTAEAQEIGWALEVFTARFTGLAMLLPLSLPTPGNLRFRRARRRLDEIVHGLIRARRGQKDSGDLLSMLLTATEEDGAMDDRQLRDEVVTLLLAGHETTALTLSYVFYLLGNHPEVEEKLLGELHQVLGERAATAADLPRLRYAEAVVRETMRLYPPAWGIGREAVRPCQIGGYEIPVGTQLWAVQWVVHRDPRYFPEPESFRPERWEGDLAKQLPRGAYFPFGGGPRICIGNAFAMMETVLLLATLLRRVRIRLASPRPLQFIASVTLRPKGGIPVFVSDRK